MKYFSMFSGVGGFELGLNANGHECVGYSDIDKNAISIYNYNFPEHKNYGDATKIEPEKLPDFDILCGGFPCQPFSVMGKQLGDQDPRGTLFWDIARIAQVKRPKYLFLENVKGLIRNNNGRTFFKILDTLDELGYNVEWQIVNSKYYGVAQTRDRIYIIGHLRGEPTKRIFPLPVKCTTSTDETNFQKKVSKLSDSYCNRWGQPGFVALRYSDTRISDVCYTLLKGMSQLFYSDGNSLVRRLTPNELERLQSFPKDWTKYGKSATGEVFETTYAQRSAVMGNAVTVNVIKEISQYFK